MLMKEMGVRHFPAPKTHPQSVGLSELYVQLITFSLRAFLCQHPSAISIWDPFLDSVVHILNCRVIKVMAFTPSQLLLGFNPTRQIAWDLNPETEARLEELVTHSGNCQ